MVQPGDSLAKGVLFRGAIGRIKVRLLQPAEERPHWRTAGSCRFLDTAVGEQSKSPVRSATQ